MNYTTISNFVNNAEDIVLNTATNELITTIKTDSGNAVLISEKQYNALIDNLVSHKDDTNI